MKLFASDMDGTLLSSDFTISHKNLDAIERLGKRGVVFALATGRCYMDVQAILKRHSIRCPAVCSNGAAVWSASGNLISKQIIPPDELARLCSYMDEHHIFYGINSTYNFTTRHDWENMLDAEGATTEDLNFIKDPVLSQFGLRTADSFEPFLRGEEDSCSISVASTNPEVLQRFHNFAARSGKVNSTYSGFGSIEVTPLNCSKASGLKALGQFLGISLAEMVSIGDNYNDLDMLLATGKSFAVRSAPKDIRAVCTGSAPNFNENGVAYIIDQLLKEE